MTNTFVERQLRASFTLGEGSFGDSGQNTVTVDGLRMSARIRLNGGVGMSQLDLRIWGMPLDVVRQLTVLNKLAFEQERNNTITLFAGDKGSTLSAVFSGTIKEAWADASSPPELLFIVSAFTGGLDIVKPVPPTSYRGTVDISTILSGIGQLMTPPRALENSGVVHAFENIYLPGTPVQQIRAVCQAARCNCVMDEQVIAIWPAGQTRGEQVLDVSAETGLIGYPQFTQNGLAFRMIYNPNLLFGQQVNVTSTLSAATGSWAIISVGHDLDSLVYGGEWSTAVECGLYGHATPISTGAR